MLRWAWYLVATLLIVAGAPGSSFANCGEGCRVIESDGTDPAAPALFLEAVLDPEINQILLDAPRYQLQPAAWAKYGGDNLVMLDRNLTIRSTEKPFGLMDFQQLERKILVGPGVTVTFESIVLQNIRKLGGFALDMFVGEEGSKIVFSDVVRVKLACQLPQDILRAARSFQRVSEQFPPNNVTLFPQFCFSGTLDASYQKEDHCFGDALHFRHFSLQASSNDPDAGRQFPGYILYQQNTTIVCQHTITEACVNQHGDEVCLAMLVADATNNPGAPFVWTKGAIAGVAVAGGVVALALLCCCQFRHHLLVWFVRLDGNRLQDLEAGSSQWVTQHALPCTLGELQGDDNLEDKGMQCGDSLSGYTGRAISQQVTLGVLLGAGSFGRVYKGRWHSSDVAIKIMSCTRAELPKVLREAEVMMQLNHPNIVRAFHASVWNPAEQMRALQAREARSSSSSSIKKRSSVGRSSSFLGSNAPSSAAATDSAANAHCTGAPPSSSVHRGSCGNDHATVRDAAEVFTGANAVRSIQHDASVKGASAAAASGIAGAQSSTPSENFMPGHAEACSSAANTSGAAVTDEQRLFSSWGSAAPVSLPSTSGMGVADNMQNGVTGAPAGCSSSSNVAALSSSCVCNGDRAAVLSSQQVVEALSPLLSLSSAVGRTAPTCGSMPSAAALERTACSADSNALNSKDADRNIAAACTLVAVSQPAAAAGPKQQGSFKQHLITQLVQNSSSGSSQRISADSSAAAVSSGGGAAALSPGAAGVMPMHSFDANQQQGSSGGHRAKQQQERAQQQQQQAGTGHELGDTHCAEVQVWIVLELCSGGTLKDAVTSGRMIFDDTAGLNHVLSRLLEAANGMAYLHSRGVLHGDLKAGNVLLQNVHATGQQVAKISDFGLAAVLIDGATHRSTASMGTITHMAPEVLRSGHMSPAADVYSFGVMMWEVFTRKQAYQGLHYGAVVERVVIQKDRPPIPDDMPEEFSLLICACWDAEPSNRPSFVQIVKCLEIMLGNLVVEQSDAIDDTAQDWQKEAANGVAGRHIEHLHSNAFQMATDATAKPSTAASAEEASSRRTAQEGSWQQQHWQQPAMHAGQLQPNLNASGPQPNVYTPPQQGPQVRVLVGPAGDAGSMGVVGLGGQSIAPTPPTVSTPSHSGLTGQPPGPGPNLLDESPYLGDF